MTDLTRAFKERLLDDDYYYGEVREAALSASVINSILDGSFGAQQEWKIQFEVGKYFHCLTLEPEKIPDFEVRDVPRRKRGEQYLKQSEVDMCKQMKLSHDAEVEARGVIYGPNVRYEVPGYAIIDGVLFIGKCDIHNPDIDYLGDLKSTSYLDGFDSSIEKWYTSQLWLYWHIFNMPTAYIVVDKKSLQTATIYPERGHYKDGKVKVLEAIRTYKEMYPDHYQKNKELQVKLGL